MIGQVTRKITTSDLESALNGSDFLNQEEGTPESSTPGTPAEKKSNKIRVCFQINETTKKSLEAYCNKYDMTQTAAIKKAIREMLQKENNSIM